MGFFKRIAANSFKDGLTRSNELGKQLLADLKDVNSMLDVGCGDGSLTLEFARIVGAKNVHAIEYQDELHPLLEKKGIRCTKSDVNERWKYPDDFFDFVLSSQNIEHVHRSRHYVEECYRVLKPNGHILILTENLASWPNIASLFFGWQPFSTTSIEGWIIGNPYAIHADTTEQTRSEIGTLQTTSHEFLQKYYPMGIAGTIGHVRVLSYEGLKQLMLRAGFIDIQVHTMGFPPLTGKISDFACKLSKKHGHFLIAYGRKRIV